MIVRVLKLGLMAVIGYAAYQFVRGILEGERAIDVDRKSSPPAPTSRSDGAVITGGGAGRVVTTSDAVGSSVPHRVGRGVVRR